MHAITDADRQAAKALREILADISGFWHRGGDDSPLCEALARHRVEAERRLADSLAPFLLTSPADNSSDAFRQAGGQLHPDVALTSFYGPMRLELSRPSES